MYTCSRGITGVDSHNVASNNYYCTSYTRINVYKYLRVGYRSTVPVNIMY